MNFSATPSIRKRLRGRRTLIRSITLSIAAFVVAINVIGGPSHRSVERAPASDAEIVAFVADEVRDTGIPGAAIAIIRDGKVSSTQGLGIADATGRPVTAATPFVIGSLSKSITATAVMQLVEGGKVELDTPVLAYLPEFGLADRSASAVITVRQLLNQTSGLPTDAGRRPLTQPATDLAGQVRELSLVQPRSAPGSRYAYSNANYVVLGRLIEVVSGESFGAYLDRHIFKPLGMANATTDLRQADANGLGRAHRLWFGLSREVTPLVREDLAPAGWVMASASDFGRFVASHAGGGTLDGSRILSESAVADMSHGVADTGAGNGSRYGLGWVDSQIGGHRLVGHVGSTTDMASVAFFSPEQRDGIVLLFNGQSTLYELAHKPDLIGLAAFELLEGREPDGTFKFLYPAFDLLAVVVLGYAVWRLLRAVRAVREGALEVPRALGSRWLGILLTIWLSGIVPVEILLGMPGFLGAPWTTLIQIDLGLVAFLFAILRLAIGAVIVAGGLAELRRRSVPGGRALLARMGGE